MWRNIGVGGKTSMKWHQQISNGGVAAISYVAKNESVVSSMTSAQNKQCVKATYHRRNKAVSSQWHGEINGV